MNYRIFNLRQTVQAMIGKKPILCQCNPFVAFGCEPGQTFECNICKRQMPWCMGAANDQFSETCDNCWQRMQEGNNVTH